MVGAALLGQREAEGALVHHHDFFRALGLGHLRDEVADGSGADDDDLLARGAAAATQRVHRHGHRFDHGASIGRQRGGEGDDLVGGHREVVLGGAGGLEAHDAQAVTDVVVA